MSSHIRHNTASQYMNLFNFLHSVEFENHVQQMRLGSAPIPTFDVGDYNIVLWNLQTENEFRDHAKKLEKNIKHSQKVINNSQAFHHWKAFASMMVIIESCCCEYQGKNYKFHYNGKTQKIIINLHE
jgi:hypothetical protein